MRTFPESSTCTRSRVTCRSRCCQCDQAGRETGSTSWRSKSRIACGSTDRRSGYIQWQRKAESAALADTAAGYSVRSAAHHTVHTDLSAELVDDPLYDRQSEAVPLNSHCTEPTVHLK